MSEIRYNEIPLPVNVIFHWVYKNISLIPCSALIIIKNITTPTPKGDLMQKETDFTILIYKSIGFQCCTTFE